MKTAFVLILDFLKEVFDDNASICDQTPEYKVVQTFNCHTQFFWNYESDNNTFCNIFNNLI